MHDGFSVRDEAAPIVCLHAYSFPPSCRYCGFCWLVLDDAGAVRLTNIYADTCRIMARRRDLHVLDTARAVG
jgi:hypothetical protein